MDITILLIGVAALFVVIVLFTAVSKSPKVEWKADIIKKLNEIAKLSSNSEIIIATTSIMEADKLLDFVMKKKNISGETMGERLKNAEKFFDKNLYNNIWNAHKVRNRLAHETDFKLRANDVKYNFSIFNQAIRKLLD